MSSTNDVQHIFELEIVSLAAIKIKLSSKAELLVIENSTYRRFYKEISRIKRYEDANKIIAILRSGITNKKQLASMCNIDPDIICVYYKLLWLEGRIEDYHTNRHTIIPKNLEFFDIELLRLGIKRKSIEDIAIGNYIAFLVPKIPHQPITLDLALFLTRFPSTEKYIYTSGNMNISSKTPAVYEWLEKNGIPNFTRGERKRFLSNSNWSINEYDAAKISFLKNTIVRLERFLTISPEIAFAMGLYMAEGSKTTPGIYFALNASEEPLFIRAVNALKEIDPNANSSFKLIEDTQGARGFFNSIPVALLMEKLIGCTAHHKHLPSFIFNSTDDVALRFLEGYFAGDGDRIIRTSSKGRYSNHPSMSLSVFSCNLDLLVFVRQLLLRFEVVAGIFIRKPSKSLLKNGKKINSGTNYNLTTTGNDAARLFKLLNGYSIIKDLGYSRKQSFFHGDYLFLRVKNIHHIEGTVSCNNAFPLCIHTEP